jgi:heat shock protein HspQ
MQTANEFKRCVVAPRNEIEYSVGQVLRHKKFGFRAVVYGWDRRPSGVQGLKKADDQPFYHMLPDQADCERLFGGPRDMRCKF